MSQIGANVAQSQAIWHMRQALDLYEAYQGLAATRVDTPPDMPEEVVQQRNAILGVAQEIIHSRMVSQMLDTLMALRKWNEERNP